MSEQAVLRELALDMDQLAQAQREGTAAFRVWTIDRPVVVIGRSVPAVEEVDTEFCERCGIAIVQRPSGGRSVLIGPGTAQYSFALPYSLADELTTIAGSKAFCNRLLQAGSTALAALAQDRSGDLIRGDRKVAGLALKRGRTAMLLHGTILVDADLALISRALRHPKREPAYRNGRPHERFLANLNDSPDSEGLDARELELAVTRLLGSG